MGILFLVASMIQEAHFLRCKPAATKNVIATAPTITFSPCQVQIATTPHGAGSLEPASQNLQPSAIASDMTPTSLKLTFSNLPICFPTRPVLLNPSLVAEAVGQHILPNRRNFSDYVSLPAPPTPDLSRLTSELGLTSSSLSQQLPTLLGGGNWHETD